MTKEYSYIRRDIEQVEKCVNCGMKIAKLTDGNEWIHLPGCHVSCDKTGFGKVAQPSTERKEGAAIAVQPAPNIVKGRDISDLVRGDIEARARMGQSKYGTRLKAFNGRDGLIDAYQEVLDLACYLRQVIEERKTNTDLPQEAEKSECEKVCESFWRQSKSAMKLDTPLLRNYYEQELKKAVEYGWNAAPQSKEGK